MYNYNIFINVVVAMGFARILSDVIVCNINAVSNNTMGVSQKS